jgi:hypothetical protein
VGQALRRRREAQAASRPRAHRRAGRRAAARRVGPDRERRREDSPGGPADPASNARPGAGAWDAGEPPATPRIPGPQAPLPCALPCRTHANAACARAHACLQSSTRLASSPVRHLCCAWADGQCSASRYDARRPAVTRRAPPLRRRSCCRRSRPKATSWPSSPRCRRAPRAPRARAPGRGLAARLPRGLGGREGT